MWSNVINIDKRYTKEIEYILNCLQSTKDVSYATEESNHRLWIYLAGACERQNEIEERIFHIIEVVVLSYFKLRYFAEKLHIERFTHATCALVSAIVHFDRDFERDIVRKAISTSVDYNIDGLVNFRMRELRLGWSELADVARKLLESSAGEQDVYDMASFITGSDGGKNQLLLRNDMLKNVTRHSNIEIVDLFDNGEYNLLSAIISEKPREILLENCSLSAPMCNTLRRFARIIEK